MHEKVGIAPTIQSEPVFSTGSLMMSALKYSHYLFKVLLRDFVALCDRLVKFKCFVPEFNGKSSVARLQNALSVDDMKCALQQICPNTDALQNGAAAHRGQRAVRLLQELVVLRAAEHARLCARRSSVRLLCAGRLDL